MKKKIEWNIVQANGKPLCIYNSRQSARNDVKWYRESMFAEWLGDVDFPLHIERIEWELKDKRVVK